MDNITKRLPPQNIEAEQAVLCAMLLDQDIIDLVRMFINGDDFIKQAHRVIFKAITDTRGDILEVISNLKALGVLDEVGGPAYLAALADMVIPSKKVAESHAKLIREASQKRKFIANAGEMIASCYGGGDFGDMAADLEKEAFNLSADLGTGAEAVSIGEIVKGTVARVERIVEEGLDPGIMTGFYDFDRMTSGLQSDDLIILAARPSMGKTALLFNILKRVALQGIPVGAFSLEMGNEGLGQRMLAEQTMINSKVIRSGRVRDNEWPTITNAMGLFDSMPLYIDDTPALHISEMRSRARRMHRKHGVSLIALDYLQMARGDGNNREQEIADISRGMKAMAKELKIPVIALAQLNRGLESRSDKRPMLSDLRESGAIEQDADVVAFIYRDDYYDKTQDNPKKGIAEVIFSKQRNGPTGTIELLFRDHLCSFENMARD